MPKNEGRGIETLKKLGKGLELAKKVLFTLDISELGK